MTCTWCTSENGCDCEERIHCDKIGQDCHKACGWCDHHGGPRFECLDRCAHWRLARVWPQADGSNDNVYISGWWAQVLNPNRDEPNAVWGGDARAAWDNLIAELVKVKSSGLIRPSDDKSKVALRPRPRS